MDCTLRDTPRHSGSTQLNYEWRSISGERKRRASCSRGAPARQELRGFRGKIRKQEKYTTAGYIIDTNDPGTCPISLHGAVLSDRSTYPSGFNFPHVIPARRLGALTH